VSWRLHQLADALWARGCNIAQPDVDWLPPGLISDSERQTVERGLRIFFSRHSVVEDMNEAIDCLRRAIALESQLEDNRLRDRKDILVTSLVARSALTESVSDLNEACEVLRSLLDPDPNEGGLFNLALLGAVCLRKLVVYEDSEDVPQWLQMVIQVRNSDDPLLDIVEGLEHIMLRLMEKQQSRVELMGE
jgi:hypothetical protein